MNFQTLENTKMIELVSPEGDHHHHIFCESCGAVYDINLNDKNWKMILIQK